MLMQLADHGCASGIDVAGLALYYCRHRGLKRLAQTSVEELPFKDQSFDLITCIDVLYHVNVAQEGPALQEFYRVLKPAGWLLIQVPAFEALRGHHDLEVHTRHRYTAPELRSRVEAAGFEAVRVSYANSFLFPAAAAKRLVERRWPAIGWLGSDLMPVPGWLNDVLRGILALECRLITRVSLPIGLSVMALARKP
jgi:SAM-dependent methyltransferase